MAKNITNTVKHFRDRFIFGTSDVTHYFPGHMQKGLRQIQEKLRDVDCIIEVHDARIPFTGRNATFKETVLVRPHILMFNKSDLTDMKHRKTITDYYENKVGVAKVLFSNCKSQSNKAIKQLLPTVLELVESNPRYNRESAKDYNLIIIGVPNVGKSSVINALRSTFMKKGKATRVGSEAGVTRSVLTKIQVCRTPPIYVLDSPGILQPKVADIETGMKLAVCSNLKDHLVGEIMIADYILYWLNKHKIFEYTKYFELDEPTDDILEVLYKYAKDHNLFEKRKSISSNGYEIQPNFHAASKKLILAFRTGKLGKVTLDEDLLRNMKNKNIEIT